MYLTGFGVNPIPHTTNARKQRIARCVGCTVDIWYVSGSSRMQSYSQSELGIDRYHELFSSDRRVETSSHL
jgi:hypothetical protein